MRRGFTLLETLLATALASAIVVGVAGWIETVAGAQRAGDGPLAWEAAASATLRLIHDDVVGGDFPPETSNRPNSETPRVRIEGEELQVLTRIDGVGAARRVYEFDPSQRHLRMRVSDATSTREDSILLDRLESFTCTLDEEHGILEVVLTGVDQRTMRRRIRLP